MRTFIVVGGWLIVLAFAIPVAGQDGPELSAQQKKLIDLTNAERKLKDLKPLSVNPLLTRVATAHAQNMVKQGKLAHVLDGKSPPDRLRDAGYKFAAAGENVARMSGSVSLESVVKMWLESKIHRDNILNPNFTEFGVGIVSDGAGQVYYSMLFAEKF